MQYRGIRKIVTGTPAMDGAGVQLTRVVGRADVQDFDPFLMLDAFDSENPADYTKGFPWHPHRGIETVTYLVSGDIEHADSLGNKGSIVDGGCQWMTAGSGIIHQEMPQAAKRMLGLQLWLNLPAKHKMTNPEYRDLVANKIPVLTEEGSRIAVLAGSCRGANGAMRGDYVDATMLDIALEAGTSCSIPVDPAHNAFIYILDGSISLEPSGKAGFHDRRRALLLGEGDSVALTASAKAGARCVLFTGVPLREPVAWGGPIVMNTREELEHAFEEIDAGTFIKNR